MVKILQETDLSETTTSYEVQVEISEDKSFEDYVDEYNRQRDRIESRESSEKE